MLDVSNILKKNHLGNIRPHFLHNEFGLLLFVRKSKINFLCQQFAIVVFTRFRIELRHDNDRD
jgi:hypothetical protein